MSKNKGSRFERLVAKSFSDAWGVTLVRTPLSGGWGAMQTKGDLVADARVFPEWPLFVECKNHEGWEFHHLLEWSGLIYGWWGKAKEQANDEGGKHPLLVFTRNRLPIYVGMHTTTRMQLPTVRRDPKHIVMSFFPIQLMIMKLEQFLYEYPIESILKLQPFNCTEQGEGS